MTGETPVAAPAAAVVPAAPVTAPPPPRRKRRGLMLALPVVMLAAGAGWWLMTGRYESTENAYLHQARISVASSLGGRITTVNIADNQVVKAGDPLFQVDPEPYKLALQQAETAVSNARLSVEQMKLSYTRAQSEVRLAQDDVDYLASELKRQQTLSTRGVATNTSLDDARYASKRGVEQLALANQSEAIALAALGGDATAATDSHPTVQAAIVARDKAAYDLSLTTVNAPADGIIYQASSFKPGEMVDAGSPLFALVETGDVWVEANLKETQLTNIRIGQPVEVKFDVDTSRSFPAKVVAIGAGTGAEFSLLPAQNATGNWVKVTQRVPVRVELDNPADAAGISSGMSAEVSIDTGRSRSLSDLVPAAFAGSK
ncbi:MAG: HlyD family secretion protein [Cereibacter sphaeroides]|uniref:HlyD family secretion protein n=1 Tax=Cereibacter sphaeroides TaxID=1063 RepID=A0A2W5SCT1_CERSP|nr:MAG: HlyD family secretion protein [Cereibacter sphaeroides]